MRRAHMPDVTMATLFSRRILDVFAGWGIPRDDLDAKALARRYDRLWNGWSWSQQQLVLETVADIIEAEERKRYGTKLIRARAARLRRLALRAGALTEEISEELLGD